MTSKAFLNRMIIYGGLVTFVAGAYVGKNYFQSHNSTPSSGIAAVVTTPQSPKLPEVSVFTPDLLRTSTKAGAESEARTLEAFTDQANYLRARNAYQAVATLLHDEETEIALKRTSTPKQRREVEFYRKKISELEATINLYQGNPCFNFTPRQAPGPQLDVLLKNDLPLTKQYNNLEMPKYK